MKQNPGLKLWIDDIRTPPDDSWDWMTTSNSAIAYMQMYLDEGMMSVPRHIISFDHDLGGDDTSRPVVIWMIENNFKFDFYDVHSANPVGVEWLWGMIERYL